MKIDPTMLMLVGGGLVGVYLLTQKKSQQQQPQQGYGADLAFQQMAQALNATQAQQVQMAALFEQALAKSGGSVDKALRDQQLVSGYVNMGLGAATAISTIIGSIASLV